MLDTAKKTFVLVHGAWHGGWCYRHTAAALRKVGARGFHGTKGTIVVPPVSADRGLRQDVRFGAVAITEQTTDMGAELPPAGIE
jgi:hypothetical protein